MTVYAITDTKKGRTGIAPTYLHTTHLTFTLPVLYLSFMSFCFSIYLLKFFIYVYSWTLFYTSFRFREIFVYCLTETVTSQPAKRKRRNEKSHSTTRSPAWTSRVQLSNCHLPGVMTVHLIYPLMLNLFHLITRVHGVCQIHCRKIVDLLNI